MSSSHRTGLQDDQASFFLKRHRCTCKGSLHYSVNCTVKYLPAVRACGCCCLQDSITGDELLVSTTFIATLDVKLHAGDLMNVLTPSAGESASGFALADTGTHQGDGFIIPQTGCRSELCIQCSRLSQRGLKHGSYQHAEAGAV